MSREQELVELFMELVDKYGESQFNTFAIPPEIHPLFLGKEGLYPFYLLAKDFAEKEKQLYERIIRVGK